MIKRFAHDINDYTLSTDIEEDENGEFVLFEDYQAEIKRLRELVRNAYFEGFDEAMHLVTNVCFKRIDSWEASQAKAALEENHGKD